MDLSLGSSDILVLAAVLGALVGAITFLFKALIAAKDASLNELLAERDYWREIALGRLQIGPPSNAQAYQQSIQPPSAPPPPPPQPQAPPRPGFPPPRTTS